MSQSRGLRWGSIPVSAYIFAGVLLIRMVVLLRLTASPFLLPSQGDMHFYNDWAQRILHGQWTDHRAFYGLPLYPYLLALLYKIFGYSPFLPGFLQACADSGTAVLIYKLSSHVFAPESHDQAADAHAAPTELSIKRGHYIGLAAAVGWALYLPEQAYSVILMPTSLAVFVFWFVAWQIVKRRSTPRALTVCLLGLLIGFTAMGIATVLFLIPLFLFALFVSWRNQSSWLRRASLAAIFLIAVVLGATPCWAHNYFIANDRVLLSAHSGVNFWIGNNPLATGYPRMPPGLHSGQEAMLTDSITVAQEAAGRELKRSEISAYWSAKANAYIAENPIAWLKLVARKVGNFWNAFQYDDLSIITNLRIQGVLLPGVKFGLIAALSIPGLFFALRLAPRSGWILAAILLHMASLLSVFVTERYRLAVIPGLLVFAAFGLFQLWQALVASKYSRVAIYLGLLTASTIFVSIPKKDPSLWALDPYNSGWQALESKNYAFANEKLQIAYAYVPENAEINFALGNLRLEQGDKKAAKAFYAATLRRDPTHEGAFNNLGVLALDEKRWDLATRFFRSALKSSPNDSKTHYLLARAYLEQNDLAQAESEIAIALRISPGQREFVELAQTLRERKQPD